MDKKQKYILSAVVAFLVIQFILVPLISRRKALSVTKNILQNWVIGDVAMALKNFVSPEKSPPIYGLKSYKIKSSRFDRHEGKLRAQFWIDLNFSADNVLPSGKTWICELTLDRGRWLASKFYPSSD